MDRATFIRTAALAGAAIAFGVKPGKPAELLETLPEGIAGALGPAPSPTGIAGPAGWTAWGDYPNPADVGKMLDYIGDVIAKTVEQFIDQPQSPKLFRKISKAVQTKLDALIPNAPEVHFEPDLEAFNRGENGYIVSFDNDLISNLFKAAPEWREKIFPTV